MVQSAQRVLEPARLDEPLVCYQGAVVVDADGTWLLHEPIELELAREAIEAVEAEGYGLNVYVDDELYVSRGDARGRALRRASSSIDAAHGRRPRSTGSTGRRRSSSAIGDPDALDGLGARMRERFAGRLWVVEVAAVLPRVRRRAGVSKASALEFLAERLGFARERTVTLRRRRERPRPGRVGGYGVAVENADPRVKAVADWVCPPAAEEGVAQVIEALLDSRA